MNDEEDIDNKYVPDKEKPEPKEPVCPRCGLRSYDEVCQACGTPIVDKSDDEEEEYDWREHKR